MFIINPNRLLNLKEYGILIPLLDKRFIECSRWVHQNVDCSQILNLENPSELSYEELTVVHEKSYIDQLKNYPEQVIIDTFELKDLHGNYHRYQPEIATRPLKELTSRISSHLRGSLIAAEKALEANFAFFLGGGLHHAMSFGGRGFCLLNDIVLSIKLLQHKKLIHSAWVIDVDAHKGDGTAQMTQHDESIITFSIHMANGWPLDGKQYDQDEKLNPWFIPSDLDIPVAFGEEHKYNQLLEDGLKTLKTKFQKPDLVVINLGSDPYEKDELTSANLLQLNLKQMQNRDQLIYDFFAHWNVPQVYLMSGGYGESAHIPYIKFFEYLKQKKVL